jgi:hypothetical protein
VPLKLLQGAGSVDLLTQVVLPGCSTSWPRSSRSWCSSAALLAELEHANLFLVALDQHLQWYRFHHLFAQLLRLELAEREPALVPVLHHRTAVWYRDTGDVEAAIYHATAAGEFSQAADLIARHWLPYYRRGGRDRGALACRAPRGGHRS